MTSPGLHQRVGFELGLRIGRVLRRVHFQRKPLQIVPELGPWFMTYGHQNGPTATGMMVSGGPNEIAISGAVKDHPGAVLGFRWRHPRDTDRHWSVQWPLKHRGTAGA